MESKAAPLREPVARARELIGEGDALRRLHDWNTGGAASPMVDLGRLNRYERPSCATRVNARTRNRMIRSSIGIGFARCAYQNARRMEELLAVVNAKREEEKQLWDEMDKEPDPEYEAEVVRRKAAGDDRPLIKARLRIPEPEENELLECAATVVVMAHMAIEAYIYDFAATALGDDAADELDKLSPVGKWLFVPRLVSGHEFKKGAEPFNRLKRLTFVRNKFAHPKSKEVADPLADKGSDINPVDEARAALRTLQALRTEAERFDESGIPESMLSDFEGGLVIGKELRATLEKRMAEAKDQAGKEDA